MAVGWWQHAADLVRRSATGVGRLPAQYQLAQGKLLVDSDDEPLARRFHELYPEGSVVAPTAAKDVPTVTCTVRFSPASKVGVIVFDDPEPLDTLEFVRAIFPDRGYVDGPPAAAGWRTLSFQGSPDVPFSAFKGDVALVDRSQVWQPLVANIAVNRVLRLQQGIAFFHAASVGIEGRGCMLLGPKESGKTTTAMTLASRGHGFLGDEVAAIRAETLEMLPFRRAASIRTGGGPRARAVTRRLEEGDYPEEKFPDGTTRVLANVRELFPHASGVSVRLDAVFFLRSFSGRAAAHRFSFGLEHFRLLTPLPSCMWGAPLGRKMLGLTRLFDRVPCYYLDLAEPEETAMLVERITRECGA